MFRIIKNYFWNIVSIISIIIIAESIYFYNKINTDDEYLVIQQSKVNLTCKLHTLYPGFLSNSFCSNLNLNLLAPIHSYVLSFHTLKEEDLTNSYERTGSSATYTVKFEIENEKIIKFNEKDFERYILNKSYDYFNKKRLISVNELIYFQNRLKFTNYITEKFKKEFSDKLPDLFNDENEMKLLSELQNQNIKDIQSYINMINNINLNKVIDIDFEYSLTKEIIKTKFGRLNYINILLISLLFGIYLNIIVVVLMQNNILKK